MNVMEKQKVDELMLFLRRVGNLELTSRFGSTLTDYRESAAEHSWRLALMVFLVADELQIKNLNVQHAMKIALIHDVAESVTGDIDAYKVITGKVTKKEKEQCERKAMRKILEGISFGSNLGDIWEEYEAQETREAKFVKALDRMEGFLSLIERHESYTKNIFYGNYADDAVKNFPELTNFLITVKGTLKTKLTKRNIEWKE